MAAELSAGDQKLSGVTISILFTFSIWRDTAEGRVRPRLRRGQTVIQLNGVPPVEVTEGGRPGVKSLRFAENEFLKRIPKIVRHPEDRLVAWEARLSQQPATVLSSFKIDLSKTY